MSSSNSEHDSDREYDAPPVKNKNLQRNTNLYVKNFDDEMDETKLCKLFTEYGSITSCKIPKDANGQQKSFGYVNFSNPSMAEAAIENLNGYSLKDDIKLWVGFFQNKNDRQEAQRQAYYTECQNRNLFISNLDESIDDQKLKEAFAEYGNISSAKVMMTRGRSKGHGFVCFSTVDEAKDAVDHMNGKELGLKPIYVAFNRSREPANNRYPQRNTAASMFHPVHRPILATNHSRTTFEVPNRWTSSVARFSTRLPPRSYSPFNDRQSQLDTIEKSSINRQDSPSSNSDHLINRRESTASNDED